MRRRNHKRPRPVSIEAERIDDLCHILAKELAHHDEKDTLTLLTWLHAFALCVLQHPHVPLKPLSEQVDFLLALTQST
jgi:hypothetical protein